MKALLMQVGPAWYGLPLTALVRVLGCAHWHPLPSAAPGLCGLLDWQGQPVPVLDLARLTLGQAQPLQRHTRLALLQQAVGNADPATTVALLVDPGGIAELAPDSPESGHPTLAHVGRAVLHGQQLVHWLRPAALHIWAARQAGGVHA